MSLPISSVKSVLAERGEKEMSDEMLVSYARSGDATAFVELTKRHANKVFQAAYRITRNRQDAEDALQDSFLRAFVHVKDFQEKSSFATWLTRIAINSALMILRKKRGGSEIPLDGSDGQNGNFDAWEPRSYLDDPESSYFRREKRRLLRRAIDQLPPVSRDVVQLRQTRDCSVKEIAQSLGITVSAVKSRLSRANSALRASLLQTGSEPPL